MCRVSTALPPPQYYPPSSFASVLPFLQLCLSRLDSTGVASVPVAGGGRDPRTENGSSQGQHPALTGSCVPSSLDSYTESYITKHTSLGAHLSLDAGGEEAMCRVGRQMSEFENLPGERIFIELIRSDREPKASREGSK